MKPKTQPICNTSPKGSSASIQIEDCVITGSNIGVFVGQNESLEILGTLIDTPMDIKCYKGEVDVESSEVDTSSIDCLQCNVLVDGTAICTV